MSFLKDQTEKPNDFYCISPAVKGSFFPILAEIELSQDLTSTSLHLNLISDSISLDRDIFLNLGRVKNLSLDLSTSSSPSNDTSAELANPANKFAPGLPFSVYLEELSLGSKAFPCTCSNIG